MLSASRGTRTQGLLEQSPARLGCTRFSSRTPSVFLSFFSTAPSLFLSIFPGKLRGNRQILGSEPSLRLVWAQNQPNLRPNRLSSKNAGNLRRTRVDLEITLRPPAWVFSLPQFCLRFCPRPALRLRETREFPEWSTKHPLFSLEISGNARCWGPSVFLFVFRKTCNR